MGRSSRHIPFLFWLRLPWPAAVFFSPGFLECCVGLDMPVYPFGSGSGQVAQMKYSPNWNQPGVLPQAVTTIWRTELGTTLVFGFNSTTGGSAYFRYLCAFQSATTPPREPSSSRVWTRTTRAPSLWGEPAASLRASAFCWRAACFRRGGTPSRPGLPLGGNGKRGSNSLLPQAISVMPLSSGSGFNQLVARCSVGRQPPLASLPFAL